MKYLMTCSLIVVALCSGCGQHPEQVSTLEDEIINVNVSDPLKIVLIPQDISHEFSKSIHAGAISAAHELNVEIFWVGANKYTQDPPLSQQIDLVQEFTQRYIDAIVLAPLDTVALTPPVEAAVQNNIPVVIIDSGLKSKAYSSFVAIDDKEAGRMGARRLAQVLNEKGTVALLRHSEGVENTDNREVGFLEEIATYPNIEIISSNQYAGITEESVRKVSQNLLNTFPAVDGIFCSNESSSFGMLHALQTREVAGQVNFVGFGTSEALITGLTRGEIMGLVARDPFDIGYQGIKTAVAIISGETVEEKVFTRLVMITPDNLSNPEIETLIDPALTSVYFCRKMQWAQEDRIESLLFRPLPLSQGSDKKP